MLPRTLWTKNIDQSFLKIPWMRRRKNSLMLVSPASPCGVAAIPLSAVGAEKPLPSSENPLITRKSWTVLRLIIVTSARLETRQLSRRKLFVARFFRKKIQFIFFFFLTLFSSFWILLASHFLNFLTFCFVSLSVLLYFLSSSSTSVLLRTIHWNWVIKIGVGFVLRRDLKYQKLMLISDQLCSWKTPPSFYSVL